MGVELAYTDASRGPPAALYAKVAKVIPEIEWPVHAPLIAEINRAEAREERRHPGPQLHDAGDLPLRRDFVGDSLALAREAATHRRQGHRAGRRAFHGRDLEDSFAGQDGADPRHARRLFAGRLDHRRRCAPAASRNIPACRWSPM